MQHLSLENKSIERVVGLLESIDHQLQEVLNDRKDHGDSDAVYTRKQAAAMLGVSTWTLDRARKKGLLIDVERIGVRHVRITGESIMKFQQQSNKIRGAVHVRNL